MTIEANLASSCVLDLMALVEEATQDFKGKVYHIFGEAELRAKTKGVSYPAVGVIYDGLRTVPVPPGSPSQASSGGGPLTCEMSFTIMLFLRLQPIALDDPKEAATTQIDLVRRNIIRKRAPSGHFWRFQLEVSAPNDTKSVAYLQRWNTTVQLG